IRLLALQSNTNVSSAITGGQVDVAGFPVTPAMQLITRGDARLLGWVGDEVPFGHPNTVFIGTKLANENPERVERFLRALRKGARDYHDAVANAKEEREDSAATPAMLALLAKYTHQPIEDIRTAIPWLDADLRLDVKDIRRQIA